jgi:hypothetical protein
MTYKNKYIKYKQKCIILKDKLNNIIKKIKSSTTNTNNEYDDITLDISDYMDIILDISDNIKLSSTDIVYQILYKIIDDIEFNSNV